MFGLAALSREIKAFPALRCSEVQHGVPQEPIGFGLVTPPVGLEPRYDVRIQTHSDRLLCRPIEFADYGGAPVQNRGSVGNINVSVFFCGDGSDVSLLLFCENLHKLSFRATQRHGLR